MHPGCSTQSSSAPTSKCDFILSWISIVAGNCGHLSSKRKVSDRGLPRSRRGGSGCLIAKKVKLLNISSQVFLCDTFTGVVKAGKSDDAYQGGEHADTAESSVSALATKIGVNVKILKGMFPDDTGNQLEKETFRFCHIDVDVYQSARETLSGFGPG